MHYSVVSLAARSIVELRRIISFMDRLDGARRPSVVHLLFGVWFAKVVKSSGLEEGKQNMKIKAVGNSMMRTTCANERPTDCQVIICLPKVAQANL